MLQIIAGQPLKFAIKPLDDSFDGLEADAKPSTVSVTVDGVVAAGTAVVSDWQATTGYLVTFTPTTAFTAGQFVAVEVPVTIDAVVRYFSDSGRVESNAQVTGGITVTISD